MTRAQRTIRSIAAALARHALLLPAAAATAIPVVWLVTASIKDSRTWAEFLFLPTDGAFWKIDPNGLSLEGYRTLFGIVGGEGFSFVRALVNSLFFASTVAVLASLFSAAGGYALARHRFVGRKAVFGMVIAALVIPPPLLIAPQYQLLYDLGLLDSYTGLILPLIAPAVGVFLFRQATMRSVPPQLLEAARMDGCGEIAMFFRIALPLLRPMLGAFMLLTFLATWNNYITPQVVLQTADKQPLAVYVANLRATQYQDFGLIMAATVVSVLPVGLVFVLLQREFVSGLTAGAVKG